MDHRQRLAFHNDPDPHLREAYQIANPDACLQSARILARKMESTYETVSARVIKHIKTAGTTFH
jgi:hypothetical protein